MKCKSFLLGLFPVVLLLSAGCDQQPIPSKPNIIVILAEAFGYNGGLNGQKGRLLEGGIRVPAIAYWKDKIQLDYNFSLM